MHAFHSDHVRTRKGSTYWHPWLHGFEFDTQILIPINNYAP